MKNETLEETPEPDPAISVPATIQSGGLGQALPAEEIKAPEKITAAQAKIEAVAQLTMAAYQRAGTLQLTPEESSALQEPFPDDAFQAGAGGKANLIYIEHAFLRDRLNKVLGLGQWSLICRNRWAEPFKYYSKTEKRQADGTRVYVEAMLVVRGCFVAEAVGAMEYYPNEATNYGDAAEGAKTAALRRCAKEFGIGLQAWSKDWCEGWWQRRAQGSRRPAPAPAPAATAARAPTPAPAPAKPASPPPTQETPERKKQRWILLLRQAGGGHDDYAREFLIEQGILLPTEGLEDYPIDKIPKTKPIAEGMLNEIRARSGTGTPPPAKPAPAPAPAPAKPPVDVGGPEEWRSFPIPFGKHAGIPMGNVDKAVLFGFWANFKVETEWQGRPRPATKIATDTKFREMLDQAGEHYAFRVRSEVDEPQESEGAEPPPRAAQQAEDDFPDDIPF